MNSLAKKIDPYCVSSYLAFRYIVDRDREWTEGWKPWWPAINFAERICIENEEEIISFLKNQLSSIGNDCGILLSGGIDSAILASFMPAGSHAYTIRFNADGAIDESLHASLYAKHLNLRHHIVEIEWKDYLNYSPLLMKHKRSPLHAIEVAIYKASLTAFNDNIRYLVVGNGADSTFGGMDKLLSRDWSYHDFIKRYTFINPEDALKEPVDSSFIYEAYKKGDGVDVQRFLKTVHGEGIIQTFCNAAETAGIKLIEPFELLDYPKPLDLNRIRKGESKYILRSIFKNLYQDFDIPEKIPFARPMEQWLAGWEGPQSEIFKNCINIGDFSGEQRWLLYILDQFVELISK